MIMLIRKEQPSDYRAVENLTREAFYLYHIINISI